MNPILVMEAKEIIASPQTDRETVLCEYLQAQIEDAKNDAECAEMECEEMREDCDKYEDQARTAAGEIRLLEQKLDKTKAELESCQKELASKSTD